MHVFNTDVWHFKHKKCVGIEITHLSIWWCKTDIEIRRCEIELEIWWIDYIIAGSFFIRHLHVRSLLFSSPFQGIIRVSVFFMFLIIYTQECFLPWYYRRLAFDAVTYFYVIDILFDEHTCGDGFVDKGRYMSAVDAHHLTLFVNKNFYVASFNEFLTWILSFQ